MQVAVGDTQMNAFMAGDTPPLPSPALPYSLTDTDISSRLHS